MSEYTPGPWIVALNDGNLSVRSEATDETIAAVTHVYPECVFGLDEDDARLIAAAPDLLEALEQFVDLGIEDGSLKTWPELRKALASAASAITKAKGGKQ